MPAVFRQRPPEVEAVQYWPTINCGEVFDFLGWPGHAPGQCVPDAELAFPSWPGAGVAHPGDWIVRGRDGECFPCPDGVFTTDYEPA